MPGAICQVEGVEHNGGEDASLDARFLRDSVGSRRPCRHGLHTTYISLFTILHIVELNNSYLLCTNVCSKVDVLFGVNGRSSPDRLALVLGTHNLGH